MNIILLSFLKKFSKLITQLLLLLIKNHLQFKFSLEKKFFSIKISQSEISIHKIPRKLKRTNCKQLVAAISHIMQPIGKAITISMSFLGISSQPFLFIRLRVYMAFK